MTELEKFYNRILEIIAHAQDNKFISEDGANVLRENLEETKAEFGIKEKC